MLPQRGAFSPPLPWPPDLLSLDLDRAAGGGALQLSLLYAQAPLPPAPLTGALSTAAALRPPLALTRAACALLRLAAPGACLAPCGHAPAAPLPAGAASLHQAAVVSPAVLLRGGGLRAPGGSGQAPPLQWLPWARGWELASAADGEAQRAAPLQWGLGLLDNATMGSRRVALATLSVPAQCSSASAPAGGELGSLPWGAEYAAGGALHLSIVRPSGNEQSNAAWWVPPAAPHASLTAPPLPPLAAAASLLGTGLARTLALQVSGLPRGAGTLALLLTLPATAFVDLDELQAALQHPPPPLQPHAPRRPAALTAFTPYLDIEQPAPPSSQHALLLRYAVDSGGSGGGGGGAASGSLTARLPLHLRHSAPGCAAAGAVQAAPGGGTDDAARARHAALLAPWRLAHPAALPAALFADGSALLAGTGAQGRFPRYSGCFRLSPSPLWRAYWRPNSSSASSAEWLGLQLAGEGGEVPPAVVPVGSVDSRAAVDAGTLALLASLPVLILLLVLLGRRSRSSSSSISKEA